MPEIENQNTEVALTTQNTETPATQETQHETTALETSTMDTSIESTSGAGQEVMANPGSNVPAVFQPNYKFKVMDKELEVPEYLRSVIKDPVSQKQVIDILQKAEGLPLAKERLRSERDDARNKFQAISAQVTRASQTYQRGDIDGFFDLLKIPHERILQWAVDKVTYSQLPAEQRQVHDQNIAAQRRAAELEEQNQLYQQEIQEQVSQSKKTQLAFEIAKPEVKAAMDQYDALVGKPGAFQEEVVNRGRLAWHQRKEDITPAQAVQEVMSLYGKLLQRAPATPAAPAQQAAPTQGAAPTQQTQTVIPNIGSKGASPVRKGPKNMADLRKLAQEASQSQN